MKALFRTTKWWIVLGVIAVLLGGLVSCEEASTTSDTQEEKQDVDPTVLTGAFSYNPVTLEVGAAWPAASVDISIDTAFSSAVSYAIALESGGAVDYLAVSDVGAISYTGTNTLAAGTYTHVITATSTEGKTRTITANFVLTVTAAAVGTGETFMGLDPIIYGDAWHSSLLKVAERYSATGGTDLIVAEDTTAANVNTGTKALKVDFTGMEGGYAGLFSAFGSEEEGANGFGNSADFSEYNTLSFDVKASSVNASMEFIILKSKTFGEYKVTAYNGAGATDLANARVVPGDTAYQTIKIPIYGSTFLSNTLIPFQAQSVNGLDTLGAFYFDNIQFTKEATLPAVDASKVSLGGSASDEIWTVVGSAVSSPQISTEGTVTLPVDMDTSTPTTYNMELVVPAAAVMGTNVVLGDTAIATASGSAITGVAAGTTSASVDIAGANIELSQVRVHTKDTDASKYYMYGNTVDYVGPFWYHYEGTMTTTFHTDAADGNNSYMRLVDNNTAGWAAGGFQLEPGTNQYIDISKFTYLVVKARAASDGTASLKIVPKFNDDGFAGASTLTIESYDATGTATATALTTSWSTHKIPVADFLDTDKAKDSATQMRLLNLEFPFEDSSTTAYKVEIDEIYFE